MLGFILELKILMAVKMIDLWQHAFLHHGCESLLLKELLRGWNNLIEWMKRVVHEGCQLDQHPSLPHLLYRVQQTAQDGTGPPDQFVQSSPVLVCAAPTPADHHVQES